MTQNCSLSQEPLKGTDRNSLGVASLYFPACLLYSRKLVKWTIGCCVEGVSYDHTSATSLVPLCPPPPSNKRMYYWLSFQQKCTELLCFRPPHLTFKQISVLVYGRGRKQFSLVSCLCDQTLTFTTVCSTDHIECYAALRVNVFWKLFLLLILQSPVSHLPLLAMKSMKLLFFKWALMVLT